MLAWRLRLVYEYFVKFTRDEEEEEWNGQGMNGRRLAAPTPLKQNLTW